MHFFKGLLTGIAATFVFSFFYKTYTHPSLTTINFLAASFYQVLPFIYKITIICAACVFLLWFHSWWKNNAAEIAEEEINRARDRAEEIKYDAYTAAAAFHADTEKECTKLRMEISPLHAAAKEKYDELLGKEQTLEQYYSQLCSSLEADFDTKKLAYTIELTALIQKNKKLQGDLQNMAKQFNDLEKIGLGGAANKYIKRINRSLVSNHFATAGVENILADNNLSETDSVHAVNSRRSVSQSPL